MRHIDRTHHPPWTLRLLGPTLLLVTACSTPPPPIALEDVCEIPVAAVTTASIGTSNTSRNIAVDAGRTIHVSWVDVTDASVHYARSLDGGLTFEPSVAISDAAVDPTALDGGVSIATGRSGLTVLAFVDVDGALRVARSLDGGAAWTGATVIDPGPWETRLGLAVDANAAYVAVRSGIEAEPLASPQIEPPPPTLDEIWLFRSDDRGATFEPVLTPLPFLAYFDVLVDPRNGDVHLIGDDPRVVHVASTDGGRTFGPLAEAPGPDHDLFYSDFAISSTGQILGAGQAGSASLYDLGQATWSRVSTEAGGRERAVSPAIDDATTLRIVSNPDEASVQLSVSTDGGVTYDTTPVAAGTSQDIAAARDVGGSPIVYVNAGELFYCFVPLP